MDFLFRYYTPWRGEEVKGDFVTERAADPLYNTENNLSLGEPNPDRFSYSAFRQCRIKHLDNTASILCGVLFALPKGRAGKLHSTPQPGVF